MAFINNAFKSHFMQFLTKKALFLAIFTVFLVGFSPVLASDVYYYNPIYSNISPQPTTGNIPTANTRIGQAGTTNSLQQVSGAVEYCRIKRQGFVRAYISINSTSTALFNDASRAWTLLTSGNYFNLIVCDDLATTTTATSTSSGFINYATTTIASSSAFFIMPYFTGGEMVIIYILLIFLVYIIMLSVFKGIDRIQTKKRVIAYQNADVPIEENY